MGQLAQRARTSEERKKDNARESRTHALSNARLVTHETLARMLARGLNLATFKEALSPLWAFWTEKNPAKIDQKVH